MGNIHIVTGYKGAAHVTAEDDGSLYAAIFGNGQRVLNRGNKFAASVISNNSIRVLDGDIMMQGRHIRLNENTYVDLTIENGAQDVSRNDLIVARYTKNASTGVEDCNLVVIKGTAAASNPSDPAYTNGNILEDHDALNDMPLYRVPIVGLNVQTLVPLFETVDDNLLSIGAKQTATKDLTASTDVVDGDYFPFYDTSASANKKTLWSNIVAKIRAALFDNANGFLKADGNGSVSATGSIGTADLTDKAVTTAKLADHAVSVDYTATLNTTWSGSAAPYTKEQTINGILAADKPLIDLVPSATFADATKQENAWALVYRAVTAANKITFYAKAKPTVSIPLQIRCVRK